MFSQTLTETLKATHLLSHPFYQAWMQGTLERDRLNAYAARYYPHVKAFPTYVSAVHSQCQDPVARRELAHNLADEEGVLGGEAHPELWLRFADALGQNRTVIENATPSPAVAKLVDGFERLCRSSYAEGLGALFAYEQQTPEISRTKIEGLKAHYGVNTPEGLSFFEVHSEADVYHSAACARALDRLSPAEQAKAKDAAVQAGQWLWDFLSEAYEPS